MATKEVALEVAAFVDSSEARGIDGPTAAEVRKIAEAFLETCYEDLGKKPRLLDGHDVHVGYGHLLPGRFKRRDPLAAHVPAVLGAYFDYLEGAQVVASMYEIRRALESTEGEFLETVRTGENVHHVAHKKQAPVVHAAPKLGRNDPCFCGSGRKFKKCHGKAE